MLERAPLGLIGSPDILGPEEKPRVHSTASEKAGMTVAFEKRARNV